MKKLITIVSLLFLFSSLSACGKGTYDDGYDAGYDEGFYTGWDRGYEDGLSDGRHDVTADDILFWHTDIRDEVLRYAEAEATGYVCAQSKWHPEEAWCVIEAYQNKEAFYEDGSMPSQQDYLDAIDSLICFYEYFYGSHYEQEAE